MPQRPNDLRPWESREALFGSELRHYREAAGFSCLQLSQKIPYAKSSISAVERAESGCDRKLAVEADRALAAQGALTRLWDGLFKGVGAVPSWFTDWFKREPDATHIRSYQPLAVDGLLQTPAYTTALLDGNEGAADTRMVRQKILTRSDPEPPNLLCVIDASVLYLDIGGRDVMREQLGHLVALSSHRVRIQVVPCVQHGGLSGPFVIGTFAGGHEVAYRDAVLRGETTVDREDITRLGEIFALIQAHAFPLGQSIEFIKRVAAEKWS